MTIGAGAEVALGIVEIGALAAAEVYLKRQRYIGTIIPDVTIEEEQEDELYITEHPVEQGSTISDHAFMRPRQVVMRCGWSDSTGRFGLGILPQQLTPGGLTIGGIQGYIDQVYTELQALQQSREPFALTTGKRLYPNMLIKSLSVTTDASSENALMCRCVFQEVIIVSTQTTQVAPKENQALPQTTAPEVDKGTVQPTQVNLGNNSVLNSLFGG
jgi:hypothetical protein